MTDCQLLSLEINGEMLIKSEEFYGVHYSICDGGLKIYAAKDGKLQISGEYIEDFIKELSEIVEQYKYKWRVDNNGERKNGTGKRDTNSSKQNKGNEAN